MRLQNVAISYRVGQLQPSGFLPLAWMDPDPTASTNRGVGSPHQVRHRNQGLACPVGPSRI